MRSGAEYFLEPSLPAQRRYEALRAYLVDGAPAAEVAVRFGYSVETVHQLAAELRGGRSEFFVSSKPGPKGPRKSKTIRDRVLKLRADSDETGRSFRPNPDSWSDGIRTQGAGGRVAADVGCQRSPDFTSFSLSIWDSCFVERRVFACAGGCRRSDSPSSWIRWAFERTRSSTTRVLLYSIANSLVRRCALCGGRRSHRSGVHASRPSSVLAVAGAIQLGHELAVHGPGRFQGLGQLPDVCFQLGDSPPLAMVVGLQHGGALLEAVE